MTVRVRKYRSGGWEVDIRVQLPDGSRHRERIRSPVPSKTGSMRWGEARALELAVTGKATKKDVPTLAEFESRYIEWCTARRLKPSTIIQSSAPSLICMSLRDMKRRATARYAAASMIEPATMILLILF